MSEANLNFCDQNVLEWTSIDIDAEIESNESTPQTTRFISNACGKMGPGLLAIVGPIDSGKTELLFTLAGQIPASYSTTGQVLLNGQERNLECWMKNVRFLEPYSFILQELTVYQFLEYVAEFRFVDEKMNIHQKILELQHKLGIEDISDLKLSLLNKEQFLITRLAAELIFDPKILFIRKEFIDLEPCSIEKIINHLKEISHQGVIVIFTTSTPFEAIIEKCDKVLLLSGGKTVYFGEQKHCDCFLAEYGFVKGKNETFIDYYSRILDTRDSNTSTINAMSDRIRDKYENSQFKKIPTKKYEIFLHYGFNFDHFRLLFAQKLKIRAFLIGNSIITLSIVIILSIIVIIFEIRIFSKMLEGLKTQGNPGVLPPTLNSNLVIEYKELPLILMFISFSISIFIFKTGLISKYFSRAEHYMAMLGIFTGEYSPTTLFLTTLLFEMTCSSVFLPVICIPLFFLRTFIDFLSCLYILIFSLMASTSLILLVLIIGNIRVSENSKKKRKFFYCIFVIFIPSAPVLAWLIFYLTENANLPLYLFNFINPFYTVMLIFVLIISENFNKKLEKKGLCTFKTFPREYLTIFKKDPRLGVIFLIFFMAIPGFFLTLFLYKRVMSPKRRLKLNLE